MRRSILADAGPLYAAVDPDDAYHRRAHGELEQMAREKYAVIVAYPTLLETYSLVVHRLGIRTATKWMEEILAGTTLINPSSEDYLQAMTKVAAMPDQSLTLFDAVVATLSARLRSEVWTYDHHFDVMRCKVWRKVR